MGNGVPIQRPRTSMSLGTLLGKRTFNAHRERVSSLSSTESDDLDAIDREIFATKAAAANASYTPQPSRMAPPLKTIRSQEDLDLSENTAPVTPLPLHGLSPAHELACCVATPSMMRQFGRTVAARSTWA